MHQAIVYGVRPRQLGDCLALPVAAGASSVTVDDGLPFSATGTTGVLDVVGMTAGYTVVVANPDGTTTLPLAAPLPASADPGDPVRILNADGSQAVGLYALGSLVDGEAEFSALLTGEQEGRFPVGFVAYEPDGWLVTLAEAGDRIVQLIDRVEQQRTVESSPTGASVGLGKGRDDNGDMVSLFAYDPGSPLFNRGSARAKYTDAGQIAAIAVRGPSPVGSAGTYATHELAATAAGAGGSQQRLAADVIVLDAKQLHVVLDGVVHDFADILSELGNGA